MGATGGALDIDQNGILYAVFIKNNGIFAAVSTDYGNTWTNSVKINTTTRYKVFAPSVTVDLQNRVNIFWHDGYDNFLEPAEVHHRQALWDGGKLPLVTPDQILSRDDGKPSSSPRTVLSATSGNILGVLFSDGSATTSGQVEWDARLAVSPDGGLFWVEVPAFGNGESGVQDGWQRDPVLFVDGNDIPHAGWTEYPLGDYADTRILYARGSFTTDAPYVIWDPPTVMTTQQSRFPSFVGDRQRGVLWMAWNHEYDPGEYFADIAVCFSTDGGSSFSPPEFVTNYVGVGGVSFPNFAVDPTNGRPRANYSYALTSEGATQMYLSIRSAAP